MDWSRPAWDAWIEILLYTNCALLSTRRVPHGTRGLKYSDENVNEKDGTVASRMGRVD